MALDPKNGRQKPRKRSQRPATLHGHSPTLNSPPITSCSAIASQEGTVAAALLSKLGQAPGMVANRANEAISKLPQAQGGDEPRMDRATVERLRQRGLLSKRSTRRLPLS